MGYSTVYSLEIIPDSREAWDTVTAHKDISGAVGKNGGGAHACTWYHHEDDMLELSQKFPGVVFKLHGTGDDEGDIWIKYFKNGKKQVCRAIVTIPPMRDDEWAWDDLS